MGKYLSIDAFVMYQIKCTVFFKNKLYFLKQWSLEHVIELGQDGVFYEKHFYEVISEFFRFKC